MAQNVTIMGASYSAVPAVTLPKTGGGTARFDDASVTTAIASDVASGKIFIASNGTITTGTASGQGNVWQDSEGYVHLDDEGGVSFQTKTVSPTESEQNVTPDSGYSGLSKVTVGAISSTYVGSGVAKKSSTDLTVSGATVTAPAGYYSSSASKSVASGTAGTPTASKGTVSNYSVSVTPSVTNTTGYITGGTKTGTAVSVSASELVSGTYSVTSSGTKDVTNYASASVPSLTLPSAASSSSSGTSKATIGRSTSNQYINIPTGFNNTAQYYTVSAVANGTAGTPTATKGTVSNNSISVTPSVTNTTGYITGGTKTGTAVTVSASELVSGTLSITSSGTKDVTNYASASVAAGTAGTPTATKGSVSNNSISVTPSVTNTTGYITGSTKTGTAVTVSASELVSGTKSITENGTGIDVTNYASVNVDVNVSVKHTATIVQGVTSKTFVRYNNTYYRNTGATFEFSAGDTCSMAAYGEMGGGAIYEDGAYLASTEGSSNPYTYTLPDCDIELTLYSDYASGMGAIVIVKSASRPIHTATIIRTDGQTRPYAQVNGSGPEYYTNGLIFSWRDGDTIDFFLGSSDYTSAVYVNDSALSVTSGGTYTYTPPNADISIEMYRNTSTEKSYVKISYNVVSDFVTGTFTTADGAGTVTTVNYDYSGVGHVMAAQIFVTGGLYNTNNTNWYDVISNNTIGILDFVKANLTTIPNYLGTSYAVNQGVYTYVYKSSSSDASAYSAYTSGVTNGAYGTTASSACPITFSSNKTSFKVVNANSPAKGLMPNLQYTYILRYERPF